MLSFRPLAGRKLLVRRQQAAHPLRLGGHLGLRLRWLWLKLGSGKLLAADAGLIGFVTAEGRVGVPKQRL